MSYEMLANGFAKLPGVEISTMARAPCLRYRGEFICMMFNKTDALIIKVSSQRVTQLIECVVGLEFNYTKKPFKEWVLIPIEYEDDYESYIDEALEFAKLKCG